MQIAIDDFGTGYSSLAYLRHLPVDVLKVDRTFIAELVYDPSASAVLAAVIHLAHTLGFVVIAEGAETGPQVALLRDLECDEIQGFYFSPPVPIDVAGVIARSTGSVRAAGTPARAILD